MVAWFRVLIAALVILIGPLAGHAAAAGLTRIRIGWQVPWATQGQLVQILKHTDILERNGLEAEFIGRTYGPLLNELALAEQVDIVLTADQPAIALFSKDRGWIGVGRLMYNRTLTYVPPRSGIMSIRDLKGKTIGVPVGAAAERATAQALRREGLDMSKDVKVVNLDIREQVPLVKDGEQAETWGTIDALSGFDPLPAIFESRGLIRVLDVATIRSLVLMNRKFVADHPGAAEHFMQALLDAYDYYRSHATQANDWFIAEAHLAGADQRALSIAAGIEPNVACKERSCIRVTFTEEDFASMQEAADFLAPRLSRKIAIRDYVSNTYAQTAH